MTILKVTTNPNDKATVDPDTTKDGNRQVFLQLPALPELYHDQNDHFFISRMASDTVGMAVGVIDKGLDVVIDAMTEQAATKKKTTKTKRR